uniref:hypothetical protein n=1 Tax=Aeromonas sp. QDB50 TaxID=2990493 RepID=UPI0022E17E2E
PASICQFGSSGLRSGKPRRLRRGAVTSGCEAEMANITLHFYLRMPYDLYCRDTLRVKQRTLQILMDYAHSLFGENPPRPIAEGSFMNQLSLLEDELADLVANFNPKRCEGYF